MGDLETFLFGQQSHVGAGQECLRALVIFIVGLGLVRLAGRRSFSRWSSLDIIVSITVGSNFSRALTGTADLWGTLAATALFLCLHLALAHGAARFGIISRVFEGAPRPLAAGGSIDQAAMKTHAISASDLAEALRKSGVDAVGETRLIMLEPSGNITVLKAG